MSKPHPLPPHIATALRTAAEALAETPASVTSCIAAPLVRAYVWATYRGEDAVEAMRLAWFGALTGDITGELECARRWAGLLSDRASQLGVVILREAGR
jgi:hypothetical protein